MSCPSTCGSRAWSAVFVEAGGGVLATQELARLVALAPRERRTLAHTSHMEKIKVGQCDRVAEWLLGLSGDREGPLLEETSCARDPGEGLETREYRSAKLPWQRGAWCAWLITCVLAVCFGSRQGYDVHWVIVPYNKPPQNLAA